MPPATPRSFRRLFGPRPGGGGRQALADVDASSLNQRCLASSAKPQNTLAPATAEAGPRTPSRKRKVQLDSASESVITPKRQKQRHDDTILSSSPGLPVCALEAGASRIRRSKVRYAFGEVLNREHGIHFGSRTLNGSVPNSLVAVGDEQGGVRLLETQRGAAPPFARPLLTLRAHDNAVVDVAFSADDRLLATASGDQTARVLDMPAQRPRATLAGHRSTVKQVRFQPGSGGAVLATAGRDGAIRVWDLRCRGAVGPALGPEVSLDAAVEAPTAATAAAAARVARMYGACVSTVADAHYRPPSALPGDTDPGPKLGPGARRAAAPPARPDVSVTALAFLSAARPHFLLSGSEANASVLVWDLRTRHGGSSGGRAGRRPMPLSATPPPAAHERHRPFGLAALAVGGDGARAYALCRDSTVYAYAASHLVLGAGAAWDTPAAAAASTPARRVATREGLGPLYGLRHPKLQVASFYVKMAVRDAAADRPELLAVGSSGSGPVVFPTDERAMGRRGGGYGGGAGPGGRERAPPAKTRGGLPTYRSGVALAGAHDKEVTDVAWTAEGALVSIGDDCACRLWREDREVRRARCGRADGGGGGGGPQVNFGEAERADDDSWDESE